MLNPNELTVTLHPTRRLVRVGLFVLIALYAAWRLYEGILIGRTPSILIGAALIFLSLFMIYQLWSYRVTVTDGYIETHGMSAKRLMFHDIVQARERKRQLHLFGSTDSIRLMYDIDRRDEVVAKIAAKLNALPVLRTSGATNYWGLAERDDEGRLARR